MVKDETICIRCGLCAERCPAHTITMEGFEVFDHDPDGAEVRPGRANMSEEPKAPGTPQEKSAVTRRDFFE